MKNRFAEVTFQTNHSMNALKGVRKDHLFPQRITYLTGKYGSPKPLYTDTSSTSMESIRCLIPSLLHKCGLVLLFHNNLNE